MPKTSHKKNRPFDFKLINMVEPHLILYRRELGPNNYTTMKAKHKIWNEIAAQMNASVEFCIKRWTNLRGQYQKELRHCRELCPKTGIIRGSTWPYLERLQFLENTIQFNKPKPEKKNSKRRKTEKIEEITINDHFSIKKSNDFSHLDEGKGVSASKMLKEKEYTIAQRLLPSTTTSSSIIPADSPHFDQSEEYLAIEHLSDTDVIISKSSTNLPAVIVSKTVQTPAVNISDISEEYVTIERLSEGSLPSISPLKVPHSTATTLETSPLDSYVTAKKTTKKLVPKERKSIKIGFEEKMKAYLNNFEGENKKRIERRLMAYLCQLQLCTLYGESTDDLEI